MADIVRAQNEPIPDTMETTYRDMGDGTHALVISPGVPDSSPMLTSIIRESATLTVTIGNTAWLSEAIDFRKYTMMVVEMPAAWTAARLAVQVSRRTTGPFLVLYDDAGNLVRFNGGGAVAVNTAYAAPPELAGARYIKLWSENGAGGNTAQAGNRYLIVHLKA